MNRLGRQNRYADPKYGGEVQERMRDLAQRLSANGRAKLCAERKALHALARGMRRMEEMRYAFGVQDDAFRRLHDAIGAMETLIAQVRQKNTVPLPGCDGQARISVLAKAWICGGETRLDREEILRGLRAFQSVQALDLYELLHFGDALSAALPEALACCCQEALFFARQRRLAQLWVERGGKGRLRGTENDVYLAHALKCTEEGENAELHRRIEAVLQKRGRGSEQVYLQAQFASAQLLIRVENLLALWNLLRKLDWSKCYASLSTAEAELNADPSGVYPAMDEMSQAEVRRLIYSAARRLELREHMVINAALALARDGMRQFGAEDPRATLCYYLCENEGRRALCKALDSKKRLRRRVIDPTGKITMLTLLPVNLCVVCLFAKALGSAWWTPLLLPLSWVFTAQLTAKIYPKLVHPRRLLKIKVEKVKRSARTLVVLPVLLSGEGRAQEMLERMETIGCLEADENIDFLLLGDYADSVSEHVDGDEATLACMRSGIRRLNRDAEREKYFYLHRNRKLREIDGKWMGENRKRGAVRALNALILNENGAKAAFEAENGCADRIAAAGYRYVVTLDADTAYVPGTLRLLLGCMLHPLNRACEINGARRGYAVLQPTMQLSMGACVNEYTRLSSASAGVDSYGYTLSDFYQDICGSGSFSGKGIYDVRAFYENTEGKLREERTLSHDMVEGMLCGSGRISDVTFYEGCPAGLSGELQRMHRWTRGDWQNAYLIFSKGVLRPSDRMRVAGNLLRSLSAPALLLLLLLSAWTGNVGGFALGVALNFVNALLSPFSRESVWRKGALKLAVLPCEAQAALDAVLRTLWRCLISQKRLMEWTTAAESDRGANERIWGRLAAILLLPALLNSGWIAQTLALAALFWVGTAWAEDLKNRSIENRAVLSPAQIGLLGETALATWRFFEHYVPEDGNGLPPDNVQLDPPVGVATRTSPTNIGLYLASCLAAYELGFIRMEKLIVRVERCLSTLEKLEKWRGQLYNWYDTVSLAPLKPRYVSSVDGGNLAAALMLISHALAVSAPACALRAWKLARQMEFDALYDPAAKLFRIGMDVENHQLSQAHYDLYASEARLLSFSAIMLQKAPAEHWKRLSRAMVDVDAGAALVSWSGTIFEYLMPELLMHSPSDSLAGRCCRTVVRAQMAFGKRRGRPWGISESGYYAFDMHLNYQYRAFGLQALALSSNAAQDVVAPYASALALRVCPAEAAENLLQMKKMGWLSEYGFYEAADYLKTDGGKPRLVKSHMAHHQGMTLCAVCNALRCDALSACFMDIPQARALALLLEEKAGKGICLSKRNLPRAEQHAREENHGRAAHGDRYRVDTHLLFGGGTTALLSASGAAYLWRDDLQINRFSGDLTDEHEGLYAHISCRETGESAVMRPERFEIGGAQGEECVSNVRARLNISVSPENGALIYALALCNTADVPRELDLTTCFAVALASQADMRAHPVFQNLFIESKRISPSALCFKRRPREAGKCYPKLMFTAFGAQEISAECDMEKLVGRCGALGRVGGLSAEFENTQGNRLHPCGALRAKICLNPNEEKQMHFALVCVNDGAESETLRALARADAPSRSQQLASALARTTLHALALNDAQHRLLQRASALLLDAHLQADQNRHFEACEPVPKELLWRAGISGDLPILLVEATQADQTRHARDILRMHAFYRAMGIHTDLVLIDAHAADYRRPVHSAFEEAILCSHLSALRDQRGGVYIVDRQNADPQVVEAITRAAALRFRGDQDAYAQLDRMLDVLNLSVSEQYRPQTGALLAMDEPLQMDNGYGGFANGGYRIRLQNMQLPPAPWSNVLSQGDSGALVTERCGGFAWQGNSRSTRLTAFANDTLSEGWGWMFYAVDRARKRYIRLLPGECAMADFSVLHQPNASSFTMETAQTRFTTVLRPIQNGIEFEITMENLLPQDVQFEIIGFVDWLMGVDENDRRMLRTWNRMGACFASGAAEAVGYFVCEDPKAHAGASRSEFFADGGLMHPMGLSCRRSGGGWSLEATVQLRKGERAVKRFALGAARNITRAYECARTAFQTRVPAEAAWRQEMQKLCFDTPNQALNLLANGFLQCQTLNCRILAKTGLYQPGGAYGFRDQLQDMLLMIHYRPELVRAHLLKSAARQFEAGDVLHWWHEPINGVRTHISDDKLFLPYVTAEYVRITGDEAILTDSAPFLRDVAIPQGREDVYAPMQLSDTCATLHEHCMRAFRSAAKIGENGLCRMGSGDWNDGMNRVGAQGRGESVWLSMFAAVCAKNYAEIVKDEADRAYLLALNERLCAAVEQNAWDGAWYLRAFADNGSRLGGRLSPNCRIDLISQAWSAFAELREDRVRRALDAAWAQLVDFKAGAVKLLAPPFDPKVFDAGYIAAYPAGVRENGAQYTHAACWYGCALAKVGDADRAHRILNLLLPNNHARTPEDAQRYCAEPYVMAADVYTHPDYEGRGGWTWYTGSGQWMMQLILSIFGYERRGNRARICPLMGDWPRACMTVGFGGSQYLLESRADVQRITLDGVEVAEAFITMQDDGKTHRALFPPRKPAPKRVTPSDSPFESTSEQDITKLQYKSAPKTLL